MSHSLAADAPYAGLTPDVVLAAVEGLGFCVDGRLLALNSYENRVYRVGLEQSLSDDRPSVSGQLVVKFYREGRWSDVQIREEHAFVAEMAAEELPVVAPLCIAGESLHRHAGYRFAVYAYCPAQGAEIDLPGNRAMLGRVLARMHAVGRRRAFQWRDGLSDWKCGAEARDFILSEAVVPRQLEESYARVSEELVRSASLCLQQAGHLQQLRIHGDCHAGNVLWQAQGPLFVDFDDSLTAPAVQDLWMFCAGDPPQIQREWGELLDGYEQFGHFDFAEVAIVEGLRAMRMLRHAAWIARRWSDPAFPRAFPWFGEPRFWERHIDELREQLEALEDPPLLRLVGHGPTGVR